MGAADNAFLAVMRAAGGLLRGVEVLLNRYGLTAAQYNVLRILRGAGDEPDITRLLDRMEKRGLISRRRDAKDRRFVTTRIAPAGLETLAALDAPVAALHRRQFGRLSGAELRRLMAALEKLTPA